MIYESHGNSGPEAEKNVRRMVEEGFAVRGLVLKEIVVRSAEHRVESIGCAIAAVLLWWR
jgi:arginine decarboxylase